LRAAVHDPAIREARGLPPICYFCLRRGKCQAGLLFRHRGNPGGVRELCDECAKVAVRRGLEVIVVSDGGWGRRK